MTKIPTTMPLNDALTKMSLSSDNTSVNPNRLENTRDDRMVNLLVDAILKNDDQLLVNILASNPKLKELSFTHPFHGDDSKNYPFVTFLLKYSTIDKKTLDICYGCENWWMKSVIHNTDDILILLKHIPSQQHSLFLDTYRENNRDVGKFVEILDVLSPSDRLHFLLSMKDKIADIGLLVTLLEKLTPEHRLTVATAYQNLIRRSINGILILKLLQESEKFNFAVNYIDYIETVSPYHLKREYISNLEKECISILRELDQSKRLDFLLKMKEKLGLHYELLTVLPLLDQKQRLPLVTAYQASINDAYILGLLLSELTDTEQLVIWEMHLNKTSNIDDLFLLLQKINNKSNRLRIATDCQKAIKNGNDLVRVLTLLDTDDRLIFIQSLSDHILVLKELPKIISLIKPDEALAFARKYTFLITDANILPSILSELPIEDRRDFAVGAMSLIKNGAQLSRMIQKLKSEDKLSFARWNLAVIQRGEELGDVLYNLEPANRSQFALDHINTTVVNWLERHRDEIYYVLKYFEDSEKKDFFIALPIALKGYFLACTLSMLPAKERLEFAQSQCDTIKNIDDLIAILSPLAQDDRFLFADQQFPKFNYKLAEILLPLPVTKRLEFAQKHNKIIINSTTLSNVMPMLDDKDALFFADCHKHLFANFADFFIILNSLDGRRRQQFLIAHHTKIQNIDELILVLDGLYTDDRLELLKLHLNTQNNEAFQELLISWHKSSKKDKVASLTRLKSLSGKSELDTGYQMDDEQEAHDVVADKGVTQDSEKKGSQKRPYPFFHPQTSNKRSPDLQQINLVQPREQAYSQNVTNQNK